MDRCLRVGMEAAKRDPLLAKLARRATEVRREALRKRRSTSAVKYAKN